MLGQLMFFLPAYSHPINNPLSLGWRLAGHPFNPDEGGGADPASEADSQAEHHQWSQDGSAPHKGGPQVNRKP